jgi:TonB family C-terminal domain
MASRVSLYTKEWCEIIFANKNKDFGAYVLRRDADRRHRLALGLVVLCFCLLTVIPTVVTRVKQSGKAEKAEVVMLSKIEITQEDLFSVPKAPNESLRPIPGRSALHVVSEQSKEVAAGRSNANEALGNRGVEAIPDSSHLSDSMPARSKEKVSVETPEDEMPLFNGQEAVAAFREYVASRIKYPERMVAQKIQGTVYVQFVVEPTGGISNVTILSGVNPMLDEEVVRVVKGAQGWTPAKHGGFPIRIAVTIPVIFRLN